MAAWIFVELYFVGILVLLPPVPVVVLADVVEGLLQRIGTHAEVGVGEKFAHSVDIGVELQLNAKALADVLHHVVHGTGIAGFKSLRYAKG